ncbi:Homogentisate 1,2-dioxygenase [Scedosporium apiospermum]|uniref:homogentisate 1,2-dioxygenase n=1 Tax=Pseudallescheria apiosperma TaxID=563466 RepID=A0A084G710_PSEDA|nr:Homogentisate 1,2-dioxygenase [Scedosporium apiospermum]KEZ43122.1 Homogentisate 1,2-dioxygenase [Scedosporium apiospermum]
MPVTKFSTPEKYQYLNGFGSYHESVLPCLSRLLKTEAIPNTLPIGANSPQVPNHGLYAEKLSGTSFIAPRSENQQTWVYRILPSAAHLPFERDNDYEATATIHHIPQQLRWDPFDLDDKADWVHSLKHLGGVGSPAMKTGISIFIYAAGVSMPARQAFYSADGDFLIVPQHGVMDIQTELGRILARPNEIVVIPRGIKYRVDLPDGPVRGYIMELHDGHFKLPELGPIGSNGLANARDFQAPVASFDDAPEDDTPWTIYTKYNGNMFLANQAHTPFDVVGWHGLYYPYKYDLGRFNAIGSISFDHPDPSIYTVLTNPTADFVIFPPRWLVQEDTFRPPWYHRNTMSEFMGLIMGEYDAKTGGGFRAAGASLHNVMSAHGPDADAHAKASAADLKPFKVGDGSMAFMFESPLMIGVTDWALEKCRKVQPEYNAESWVPLKRHFKWPTTGEGA